MPKVSVLVAMFRPGGIDVTLVGLRDQTFKDFEVVLVDRRYERRHERVMAMAADYGLDLIHVPEHRRNGKWQNIGSAWNTAMAVAEGEIVIFLPDWTYVPPGWIGAHLLPHASGDVVYVACPYRYTDLPPLKLLRPFDFSGQLDRGRVCLDEDAVLRGEVFDEISAFAAPFTWETATSLRHHEFPHQDTRQAAAGQSLEFSWIPLKNESVRRSIAYKVNGLDERLDRGKGPLDIDWASRLSPAGCQSTWTPEGLALCPNPRWICGSMPWGSKEERVEGRWSYWDGNAYNARRQDEAGRGKIRARNPFDIEELHEDLVRAGWRDKDHVIDVGPLDRDDLTYWGKEIWPDTP